MAGRCRGYVASGWVPFAERARVQCHGAHLRAGAGLRSDGRWFGSGFVVPIRVLTLMFFFFYVILSIAFLIGFWWLISSAQVGGQGNCSCMVYLDQWSNGPRPGLQPREGRGLASWSISPGGSRGQAVCWILGIA